MCDVFAVRFPMNIHASGPAIGAKMTISVHTSACGDDSNLAARESEISAITSKTRATATATDADQATSYQAGISGITDSDMRRAYGILSSSHTASCPRLFGTLAADAMRDAQAYRLNRAWQRRRVRRVSVV